MKLTIEAELGIRIRYLRKVRKLSIEELAFKSGVNKNYLGDLERGTRNPTLKILKKIADGLQITLSDLLKGIKGIN